MDKDVLKNMSSQTLRNPAVSGNGWREHLDNFELRSRINQIAKVSELASFLDPVVLGISHKTMQHVEDGFGGFITSIPRTHSSST